MAASAWQQSAQAHELSKIANLSGDASMHRGAAATHGAAGRAMKDYAANPHNPPAAVMTARHNAQMHQRIADVHHGHAQNAGTRAVAVENQKKSNDFFAKPSKFMERSKSRGVAAMDAGPHGLRGAEDRKSAGRGKVNIGEHGVGHGVKIKKAGSIGAAGVGARGGRFVTVNGMKHYLKHS